MRKKKKKTISVVNEGCAVKKFSFQFFCSFPEIYNEMVGITPLYEMFYYSDIG